MPIENISKKEGIELFMEDMREIYNLFTRGRAKNE